VVTSNSSPDCSPGKRRTVNPHSCVPNYERGLATIPLCILSRRVHAPVMCSQHSGKRQVIRFDSPFLAAVATQPFANSHRTHYIRDSPAIVVRCADSAGPSMSLLVLRASSWSADA
jgi:hypothetical protein